MCSLLTTNRLPCKIRAPSAIASWTSTRRDSNRDMLIRTYKGEPAFLAS
jgi:hypothetical protein